MINERFILNQDNEKLFVETYTPTNIKSTIVFCHGITGCRKGRTKDDNYFQELAKRLMNLNYKLYYLIFQVIGIAKDTIMMFVYQKIQKN